MGDIDYRSFSSSDPTKPAKPNKEVSDSEVCWWDATDPAERAQKFEGVAKAVKTDQASREQQNLLHARLYGNFDAGMTGTSAFVRPVYTGAPTSRVSMNVVASCIDTLCSKVAKNKPRPSFQTDGAGWDMQQRARKLDRWNRGVFYEAGVYKTARQIFKDACIFGTAAAKIYVDKKTKRFCFERVFMDELYVDEADGLYGEPQQVFQHKLISKHVLCKQYAGKNKDLHEAIMSAKAPEDNLSMAKASDLVEVWEGWKLGGMHVIVCNGVELFSEKWDKDFFPFVFFRYNKRVLGFFGQGLAEQLIGIQQELNRLVRSVSEQLRRKGRGRIFVQQGSKVVDSHITNRIAEIVHYIGQPPVVDNQNAVAREEFDQIRELRTTAFQIAGISELSAAAKKPSGLDAAVALREFNDIESDRFASLVLDWEDFFLEISKIFIALARDMGAYKVKIPNRRFVEQEDFKDIALKEEDYAIQMFPVSSLPQTPAARYQKVKEMQADGFIDKATAQRLLEFPDIEAESNLGNAAIDDCDATISAILDAKTPKLLPPEQYQNLEMLITRTTASYLFAKHHGCPKDRLELLRQLIDRSSKMILGNQPPAPAPGPGAPDGAPAPAAPAPAGPNVDMGANVGNLSVNLPGAAPAPAVPPMIG